jgi:molybdopterin synthase catalytic subunit
MAENVIIEVATSTLDYDGLRDKLNFSGCGCIVSFIGITRGQDDGEAVLRLEFDAWQDRLEEVLRELAKQAINRFSILGIAMSHRVGSVTPEEPIVAIHVGAAHRAEGFTACSWLIDELKSQAPLWKKEVKSSGENWKAGLG